MQSEPHAETELAPDDPSPDDNAEPSEELVLWVDVPPAVIEDRTAILTT